MFNCLYWQDHIGLGGGGSSGGGDGGGGGDGRGDGGGDGGGGGVAVAREGQFRAFLLKLFISIFCG